MILLWRMLVLSERKRLALYLRLSHTETIVLPDSDNSEAVGSPSTISPLRVMILLFQMHPMRSIQQHWDKLKVSALNQFLLSQESTDKLSFIVDLLLKYGPIAESKFKVA